MIEQGPPGPPDKVTVEEITDSTAQLSWTPGRDNGSPITGYLLQARTPFTVGWQAADTGDVDQTLKQAPICTRFHILKDVSSPQCQK